MVFYLEFWAKKVTSSEENPLYFLGHLFTGFVSSLSFSTFLIILLSEKNQQEQRNTMYFQEGLSKNHCQRLQYSVPKFCNLILSSLVNRAHSNQFRTFFPQGAGFSNAQREQNKQPFVVLCNMESICFFCTVLMG